MKLWRVHTKWGPATFLFANCVAVVVLVVTLVVVVAVVAGRIIYQAQRKKENIFVMLNCQTAHLVITYVLLALQWLPPLAASPVVCHLACHTHAAGTHTSRTTRTPTQNVIKSCHASLRLSFVFFFIFAFVFVFMFVSVSVASAQILA